MNKITLGHLTLPWELRETGKTSVDPDVLINQENSLSIFQNVLGFELEGKTILLA